MEQRKGGRPKKVEVEIWEEKYYRLSEMRDNQAIRNTVVQRLRKVYTDVFTLAHDKEPNQKDVGKINRAVGGILDRI